MAEIVVAVATEIVHVYEQESETVDAGVPGPQGPVGPSGTGVPDGGAAGQLLVKQSEVDGDADWEDPEPSLPLGGVTGQVLIKQSGADGDADWEDMPTPGGVGDMLKEDYDADNDGKVDHAELSDAAPWAGITGKPPTFPPDAHSHAIADISDLNKGMAGGVASLDGAGKVPASQLPSYVDDVIEAANFAALPGTGSTGVIYVTLDDNKTYRWSGSAYVEISPSPGSTDSVTEGATNLYFTAARVRDTILTGLSLATNAAITAADTVLSALGKLQKQITDHLANTSNPHSVTKSQVGLGNADNTSDANKPISTATQTALDAKQSLDADLTAIAGLSPSNDDIIQRKSGAWTNRTPAQLKTDLSLTKSDVGLGNVDNTSDTNKPVSTAQQTALDAKQATLVSGTNIKTINSASVLGSGNITTTLSTDTPQSMSGTAVNFSGIPAGTKRVTVNISGMSTNGTSLPMLQIGDSGGIETSGYTGSACSLVNTPAVQVQSHSSGFLLAGGWASSVALTVRVVLELVDASADSWLATIVGGRTDAAIIITGAGSKSLTADLDRVRITTVGGTDTFDAGTANILYEE